MTEENMNELNNNEEIIQNEEIETEEATVGEEQAEENEDEVIIDVSEPIIVDGGSVGEEDEREKKKNKIIKKVAFVAACAILFGAVSGSIFSLTTSNVSRMINSKLKIDSTKTFLTKAETEAIYSQTADIAEECMPSIVSISSKSVTEVMTFFGVYEQENTGSGSGIVIGKNDSEILIVTNYHVIADSTELSVMLADVELPTDAKDIEKIDAKDILKAKVKGYDSDKDLAVISVKLEDLTEEQLSKIKVATIGDSSGVRAGERVIAIGNALGYGQSVTEGIISATKRAITMESQTTNSQTVTNTFIQTDAAINPGNSGGALLNMNGEVIGINSAKISASGVEGMGYAIPISDVEEIIGELMVRETREVVDEDKQGFLGVTIKDISSGATSYGIPEGVFVDSVSKGSAAEKAGIKKGYIITKFDGYTVKSGAQLQDRLTYYKAGEKKTITVQTPSEDGYKEKELEITLDSKKEREAIMQEENN